MYGSIFSLRFFALALNQAKRYIFLIEKSKLCLVFTKTFSTLINRYFRFFFTDFSACINARFWERPANGSAIFRVRPSHF